MTFKINICLLLIIIFGTFICGKTYTRNELMNELIEQHDLTYELAAKVSCIAEVSIFETHRIIYHEERLENDWKDKNLNLESASFKPTYGIFQISSEYWCTETGVGGLCHANCQDFLDDDITDDVKCFKKIAPNLTDIKINPFKYTPDWTYPWYSLYGIHCLWFQFELNTLIDLKVKGWTSLDDCSTNYPSFQYFDSGQQFKQGEQVFYFHEFAHSAAIGWSDPKSNKIEWKCGGSLISEDMILTAAHCLPNRDLPDVVRMGDLNLEDDSDNIWAQQIEILSVYIHPEYRTKFNDVALIKLKTKVDVSTDAVVPACLWDRHDIPAEVNLKACGFGQTKYGGGYSPSLMKVSLSTISTEECDEHYYGADRFLQEGLSEKAHLCANDKSGIGMDACHGDSGSPLEMKLHYGDRLVPFIVGITSFGENCGAGTPGVYARVSSYVGWIKGHIPDLDVNAVECSKKYEEKRHIHETLYQLEFEPQKFVFGDEPGQNTTATIISDQFLIAAASNLKKISKPKWVHFSTNSSDILIAKIFYHPKYLEGNPENDLALIKLKFRIRWKYKDHPSCVTQKDVNGLATIEESISQEEKLSGWNETYREKVVTSELKNCLLPTNETNADLKTETNLTCFKNLLSYHVPTYCNVPVGSAIYEEVVQTVLKGLALQSQDCTFTLATDISKHYAWINSVVFGSEAD